MLKFIFVGIYQLQLTFIPTVNKDLNKKIINDYKHIQRTVLFKTKNYQEVKQPANKS